MYLKGKLCAFRKKKELYTTFITALKAIVCVLWNSGFMLLWPSREKDVVCF